MPIDPKSLETIQWFEKAKQDLELALHDLQAKEPFTGSSVFHSQQVAEKALKGFLTWHQIIFKKTHSISDIGAQALEIENSLASFINEAINLTPYATVFRYPGEAEEPSLEEAEKAIQIAKNLLEAILKKVPNLKIK